MEQESSRVSPTNMLSNLLLVSSSNNNFDNIFDKKVAVSPVLSCCQICYTFCCEKRMQLARSYVVLSSRVACRDHCRLPILIPPLPLPAYHGMDDDLHPHPDNVPSDSDKDSDVEVEYGVHRSRRRTNFFRRDYSSLCPIQFIDK